MEIVPSLPAQRWLRHHWQRGNASTDSSFAEGRRVHLSEDRLNKALKLEQDRPSVGVSILIYAVATITIAVLRLYIYNRTFIALSYGLPLLICLWHRDLRLLWALTVTYLGMATFKAFFFLSDDAVQYNVLQWGFQVANVLINAGTVHASVRLMERLAEKNASLEEANEELAAREEE